MIVAPCIKRLVNRSDASEWQRSSLRRTARERIDTRGEKFFIGVRQVAKNGHIFTTRRAWLAGG
jgi:hypothetical protein